MYGHQHFTTDDPLVGLATAATAAATANGGGFAETFGDDDYDGLGEAAAAGEQEAAAEAAETPATGAGPAAGDAADADEVEDVTEKMWRLRAAARAIVPGAAHWDVKNKASWPPGAVIPNAAAMKWEVVQRIPLSLIHI